MHIEYGVGCWGAHVRRNVVASSSSHAMTDSPVFFTEIHYLDLYIVRMWLQSWARPRIRKEIIIAKLLRLFARARRSFLVDWRHQIGVARTNDQRWSGSGGVVEAWCLIVCDSTANIPKLCPFTSWSLESPESICITPGVALGCAYRIYR